MAVDLEKLKWAINDITEVISLTDDEGNLTGDVISVNNKEEPSAQIKLSGLKYKEPFPRAYLNYTLSQLYIAIEDLETRLTALEP